MTYQSTKLNESEDSTVMFNDETVTVKDFNEAISNLKGNQRVVETSEKSYHLVERMQGWVILYI